MPTSVAGLFNRPLLLINSGFTWFGLIVAIIASGAVLANDGYFLSQGALTINVIFLAFGALLALLTGRSQQMGLALVVLLLPLCAGMAHQIDGYFGVSILVLPNAGLDLVAGFFLGYISQLLFKRQCSLRGLTLPWPIGLMLLAITLSTALSIARNIRQSATETSVFGLLFNLIHFRPIGWHDDYMPIADWVAYGIAGALIIALLKILKGVESPNQLIFRSLVAGLILAFLMGLFQSATGLGLPSSQHEFRRDGLGFAAIGFQPDIHAFAGHMLLGALGLWAYFQTCHGKLERLILLMAVSFSWIGLLISKSRSSLIIAICASLAVLLIYIWHKRRRWFYCICVFMVVVLIVLIASLIMYSDLLMTYPVFSWLIEPIQLIKNKDFTNLSVLGGASGSRFEIWSAAFNMIKAFPLMGVGQGNFYHLSADIAFSKSHFLALNGGENAHNYFLQTFAELGIVGIIGFVLVFTFPFINTKNRTLLLPAGLGIFALFLGNVYSHSFLVRENLLLCATLLGLMYFLASKYQTPEYSNNIVVNHFGVRNILIIVSVLLLGLGSVREVYQSFYAKIFEIGVNCFKVKPLTGDGWTSGLYELDVPSMKSGIEFNALRPKARFKNSDVEVRIDLLTHDGWAASSKTYHLTNGQVKKINVSLPNNQDPYTRGVKIRIRTSTCLTPRNLGINQDSRRLGFYISNIVIF
jgi:O-antigen ligase